MPAFQMYTAVSCSVGRNMGVSCSWLTGEVVHEVSRGSICIHLWYSNVFNGFQIFSNTLFCWEYPSGAAPVQFKVLMDSLSSAAVVTKCSEQLQQWSNEGLSLTAKQSVVPSIKSRIGSSNHRAKTRRGWAKGLATTCMDANWWDMHINDMVSRQGTPLLAQWIRETLHF